MTWRHAILLGLIAGLLPGCTGRAPPDPILVGHLAPFTGPDHHLAEQARRGIELALQEEGKIGGRRIEVLHVDTHGDLEVLQAQAARLIAVNRVVALLGGADAERTERLTRAAQPAGVAVLSASSLAAAASGDAVFALGATPAARGDALARFAKEELKAPGVAVTVLDSRNPADVALSAAFARTFVEKEYRVEEMTLGPDADLPRLVERVTKAKPAVVLFAGPPAAYVKLRTQAPAETKPLWLYGGEERHLAALEADRTASPSTHLALSYAAEADNPRNRAFVENYRAKFGAEPDLFAALAYERVRLLHQAVKQAQPVTAAKVREVLAKVSENYDESLTGALSYRKDQGVRRPVFVVRLDDGRTNLLKQYEP